MKTAFLRFSAYCIGTVVAITIVAALFAYSINRREVQTAQQMMEDASRLEVQTSTFSDVLAFNRKYDGEATGSLQNRPCLESDCLVTVAPDKNDFWERHPKLGYVANRLSKRAWFFGISIWVKDGKLTAIEQSFGYSTPKVGAFVAAGISQPSPRLCGNPFYRLHRAFVAYAGTKRFNVWVNPTATREKEMLRLNVDCVPRMSGCKGVPDMAPMAWKAYESDKRVIDANESKPPGEIAADPQCR
jgi:hypothetical protein